MTASLLLVLVAGGAWSPAAAAKRPNFLVIISDDEGWGDIGYNNPTRVYTPNLNKLAGKGATFANHYVMPQCTPTRVAAMTGRPLAGAVGTYEHRYRSGEYGITWHRDEQIIPGYENGTHVTDLVAADAVRFIRQAHEQPFFLYLAFHAPHTPLDERGTFVDQPTALDPQDPTRWHNEDQIEWFNDPESRIQSEPDPQKRLLLAAPDNLDGTDLSPVLFGIGNLPDRELYWVWNRQPNRWALREGDWKIVRYGSAPAGQASYWQLFNLRADPMEETDVAGEHPEAVQHLHELFIQQHAKDAQL